MKPINQPTLAKAVLSGLSAFSGALGLSDLAAKTPQRQHAKPGKHNRGPYTRNRKSRGMNPKKRKRRELRAMRKRIEQRDEFVYHPHLYLAFATERPPWSSRQPKIYAQVYIFAEASPVERARWWFREQLMIDEPFAVQLKRVKFDRLPDEGKVAFPDNNEILHDRDVRHPMPKSMRGVA